MSRGAFPVLLFSQFVLRFTNRIIDLFSRQCFLNRILSLDPRKFERQLIYHVSNNKQRTVPKKKVIRVRDFYGQILTVKERAEKFVTQP